MYSTKAIKFVQNGRVFYVVAIPAAHLVRLTKVDVWDPANPLVGYQRAPSMARKRAIGRYAMRPDAIMPVGGLVNARPLSDEDAEDQYGTVLQFVPEWENGIVEVGQLTIPDEIEHLYIVDMQHRLGGYDWALEQEDGAMLSDFPLVVTIADGLSRLEEVDQFDLINTTQKKVRTDLARRLKVVQAKDPDHRLALDQQGKLWQAKGPVIADILNKGKGVWHERILPPNKSKRDMRSMIIRETSFVTSLKPVLKTPYFVRQQEEHAAELIRRYWEAIRRVFPEAFLNPDAYVIQKTPGVYSLHQLAPEIFELARDKGDVSTEALYEIASALAQVEDGSDFWHRENDEGAAQYGSMKGFRILASTLRQYLPSLSVI
jgi:DGQHR domain-containing protein